MTALMNSCTNRYNYDKPYLSLDFDKLEKPAEAFYGQEEEGPAKTIW
ncbi:MAG: hypothetical protein QXW39_08715 [Candidatus Bathyarchaeia archaeon]